VSHPGLCSRDFNIPSRQVDETEKYLEEVARPWRMRNRSWSTKLRALLEQHFFMSLTNSLMLLWNLVELEVNSHCLDIRGKVAEKGSFGAVLASFSHSVQGVALNALARQQAQVYGHLAASPSHPF
jgi:hypothetical protein